jgi:iron complex outermembrane receptor protein
MPYLLTSGLALGQMVDNRKDINADYGVARSDSDLDNFNRKETQTATIFDQYFQGNLTVIQDFDLHAGLRHTRFTMKFKDLQVDPAKVLTYTGPANPVSDADKTLKADALVSKRYEDTSGSVTYDKTTPVIGGIYKLTPAVNLYANAGIAFETPTLGETSFLDASTGSGPNLSIKPSTSNNYEAGAKAFLNDNTKINLTIFQVDTQNEIIINETVSGRTSYQNGKSTKRTGAEISLDSLLPNNFTAYASYTQLNATFEEGFTSGGKTIVKGNLIPGTYKQQAFAELAWSYPSWGLQTALNAIYNSSVQVNDTNEAGTATAGYTVFNLRASLNQKSGPWSTTEYITLNNLTDVKYIGSVRVNDYTAKRYYEPAAPFNWILGVKAAYKF